MTIDYDCAYTNPTILQTCLGICKSADCIDACTEEQSVVYDKYSQTAGLNPFLQLCTDGCSTAESPTIQLDPIYNNETIISGSFDVNSGQSCSYHAYGLPELLDLGSRWYDYQIEINITDIVGVTMTIFNGTTIYGAGDYEATSTPRNLTYNATDYNNLYFTFSPIDGPIDSSFFSAHVGLVPKEIWIEDDDDDITAIYIPDEIPPILKHVTFNEWLIIVGTILGLVFYYIKVRYFNNACMLERKTDYNRWVGTKKVIEELIEVNNPPDPWGGIDDEQTVEPNKMKSLLNSASGRSKVGIITSV